MKPIRILLAEDNEGDILLIQDSFSDAKVAIHMDVVKNGEKAIEYLQEKSSEHGLLPDIVLLDINLPRKSGIEVLKFIKHAELLKHIPVIILTTSSSEKDINEAYDNYVNCYITKPVSAEKFIEVVSKIEDFWISIVKLPVSNETPKRP